MVALAEEYVPLIRQWQPGQQVTATLSRLGESGGDRRFTIAFLAGSGFASQVYKATDDRGQDVALKVYRPAGHRESFRDLFHKLAWGIHFPPRSVEAALVVAEAWHEVLKRAVETEGIEAIAFPRSDGHFFDDAFGSFVSVYEWVNAQPLRPPISGSQAELDYHAKREAFRRLCRLADRIGAIEINRQWDWQTLVAPLNGLPVASPNGTRFCIVDTQPGLPIFDFLPLSPGDIRRAWALALAGRKVHFDRSDFGRLDRYVAASGDSFIDLRGIVATLKEADQQYRDSLPAPLTSSWRRYLDPTVRSRMRRAVANACLAERTVSRQMAHRIDGSTAWMVLNLLAYNIPVVGAFVQRCLFNDGYQRHLAGLLFDREYRRRANLVTIGKWHRDGRVSDARAEQLRRSDVKTLLERPLSHLPRPAHRFLTDRHFAWDALRAGLGSARAGIAFLPLIYLNKDFRRIWLLDIVAQAVLAKIVSDELAQKLYRQIDDDRCERFILDIITTTVVVALIALPISVAVAALGLVELGYPLLSTLVVLQFVPLAPKVSIASVFRACYLSWRVVEDRIARPPELIRSVSMLREIGVVAMSVISPIGNIAAPIRMAGAMPELSAVVATHYLDKIRQRIPVFGDRGTVVEAFMYDWMYNRWVRSTDRSPVRDTNVV